MIRRFALVAAGSYAAAVVAPAVWRVTNDTYENIRLRRQILRLTHQKADLEASLRTATGRWQEAVHDRNHADTVLAGTLERLATVEHRLTEEKLWHRSAAVLLKAHGLHVFEAATDAG